MARFPYSILLVASLGIAGCSDGLAPTAPMAPSAPAAPPDRASLLAVPVSSLVHWWSADGNAADGVGGAHGRTVGSVAYEAGRMGQAFSFDGGISYVELDSTASLDRAPRFTISLWIRTDTAAGQLMVQRDRFEFNGEYMLGIGHNHDKTVTRPGRVYFMIYNNGFQWELFSVRRIDDGRWHHVAAVRDSLDGRLWIDGELDASAQGPYRALRGTLRTYLGADVRAYENGLDPKPYYGLIDDVRVYSTALDGSAIAELIEAARDTTPPEIVAVPTGTEGEGGWYVSDVTLAWSVHDPQSIITATSGCDTVMVTTDTAGERFTCAAASEGGADSATVTIRRDTTAPVVSYAGNRERYTVDETVAITCTASDATSGLALNGCAEIAGDAYAFDVGLNTFSATASDAAGNVGRATTSFQVVVTYDSLCTLTRRFVDRGGIAGGLCSKLDSGARAAARGDQDGERKAVDRYIRQVRAQSGKAITVEHAAILIRLAGALAGA